MEYRLMGVGDDFVAVVEVEGDGMRTIAQPNSWVDGQKIVNALNAWVGNANQSR